MDDIIVFEALYLKFTSTNIDRLWDETNTNTLSMFNMTSMRRTFVLLGHSYFWLSRLHG